MSCGKPTRHSRRVGIAGRYDGWTGRITNSFMVGPMNPTGGAYGPGSPTQDYGNVDPTQLWPGNYVPNFGIGGCLPCGGIGRRGIGRRQRRRAREASRVLSNIERRRQAIRAKGVR